MSACRHRPESGCVFIPCARRVQVDGEWVTAVCKCAAEVKADQEATPDAHNRPLSASEVTSG